MEKEMKWSRIQNHPIAVTAVDMINQNGLEYHNMEHITSMYDFLHIHHVEYDPVLDWAVLFHDIVYDAKQWKESRSAIKFREMCSGFLSNDDITRGMSLINFTADHIVSVNTPGSSEIIRADLSGLASTKIAAINRVKIEAESMRLYDITKETCAENSNKFLELLKCRVSLNKILDKRYEDFYVDVIVGIDQTILTNTEILMQR